MIALLQVLLICVLSWTIGAAVIAVTGNVQLSTVVTFAAAVILFSILEGRKR